MAQERQPSRTPEVPYVATADEAFHAMLNLAHVANDDVVYGLGGGDGRIVIAAAKNYGTRGSGIDIDSQRIREATENARNVGMERLVRFEQKALFQALFTAPTMVTLFLREDFNVRLRPELLKELSPGSRIVSNTFDMYDWKPDKQLTLGDPNSQLFNRKLYLWIVPKK